MQYFITGVVTLFDTLTVIYLGFILFGLKVNLRKNILISIPIILYIVLIKNYIPAIWLVALLYLLLLIIIIHLIYKHKLLTSAMISTLGLLVFLFFENLAAFLLISILKFDFQNIAVGSKEMIIHVILNLTLLWALILTIRYYKFTIVPKKLEKF